MPISMSRSAKYVTQSSIWDCQRLGPLTDRRIAKYQKQGWYDGVKKEERKQQHAKSQAKKTRKNILALLLS